MLPSVGAHLKETLYPVDIGPLPSIVSLKGQLYTRDRSTLPDTTTSPLGVYFVLKSSVYLINSVITLDEIGEGEDALICKTNNRDCAVANIYIDADS